MGTETGNPEITRVAGRACVLRGDDIEALEAAASIIVGELQRYPGVTDIRDSHREGKQQLQIQIR